MLEEACASQFFVGDFHDFCLTSCWLRPFLCGKQHAWLPACPEHVADALVTLYYKGSLKPTVFLLLKGVDIFYCCFA
jgi:hypothetical protein